MIHTEKSFYDTVLILFIFQEKVIPEEDEEEEEENDSNPVKVANNHHHHNHYNGSKDNAPISTSPYDSAIEGYKSFAKSKLNGTTDNHKVNFSDDSDRSSSLSTSASTSSMSPAPTAPSSSSSHRHNESVSKHDDEWEEKIETFVQPARRVSSEISDKMKQKLANFEDSKSGKEQTPVRLIEPDNSFKDKLKAFKTIESSVSESVAAPAKSMPSRRESEPNLPNIKPKVMPNHRSTSSSFMNTFQNNKFFQQVTSSLNATSQREKNLNYFALGLVPATSPASSFCSLAASQQHTIFLFSFIHFFPFFAPCPSWNFSLEPVKVCINWHVNHEL